MSGELKKMRIEAFSKIDFASKVGEFSVMFNPSSYSQKYEVEYEDGMGKGTTGSARKFSRIKTNDDYAFDFIVDGTGASSEKKEVADVVKEFLKVAAEPLAETHRPPFIKLSWGSLVCECVLKTTDISYTLFKPNGYPLRAKIKAVFSKVIEDKKRTAKEGYSSPDLTHHRRVREGDTLPLMTHRIYGDPSYYLKVARFNGLKDFRNLVAGSFLSFPPLKQRKAP